MKLFLVFTLVAVMAFGLQAADLAGTWKGSMETQGGTVELTIALKPGPAVAGTVKSDQFAEAPIENAKVDGDKIAFEINISYGKVVFEGAVSGEEMKLTVTGTQGNTYPLRCTRQKQ
jgi:hypothetical protein